MMYLKAGYNSIAFNVEKAEKGNRSYLMNTSNVSKVLPMFSMYTDDDNNRYLIDNGNYSGDFLCFLDKNEGVLLRNIEEDKYCDFRDFIENISLGLLSTGYLDFLVSNDNAFLKGESLKGRSSVKVSCLEQAYLRWVGLKLKDILYDFSVNYKGQLLGDLQSEIISIRPTLRTLKPDYSISKGDLVSISGYVDFITSSPIYGVVALITVLSDFGAINSESLCYELGNTGLSFDVNTVYSDSKSNLCYGNKILFVLNKKESVVKEENGICVM